MSFLIRFLLGFSLVLTSLFLILLVLIQRGRGGGLAGAFGGMGGQSAFGTKAGDIFTRITVAVAGFWILLCILTLNLLGKPQSLLAPGLGSAAAPAVQPRQPDQPGAAQPGATAPETDLEAKPAVPETEPATPETKPAASETPPTTPDVKPEATPAAPAAAANPAAPAAAANPAAPAAAANPAAPAEPTK
jgi:preprotein translocase subunit SecG